MTLGSDVQKLEMFQALHQSLQNEDVCCALPEQHFRAMLDLMFKCFAAEKARQEGEAKEDVTRESKETLACLQKTISLLLNSKDYTTCLVSLLQIVRNSLPDDFSAQLKEDRAQVLKAVTRTLQKLLKFLEGESDGAIRSFDVLLEMQRLFVRHPPEKLRQDLPSLSDFDGVYRVLKQVSDKLIQMQPEKAIAFVKFQSKTAGAGSPSAFLKYLFAMLGLNPPP